MLQLIISLKNIYNKVDCDDNKNRFNEFAENAVIEEKEEDEIEANNDKHEEIKGKIIKPNEKENNIRKKS